MSSRSRRAAPAVAVAMLLVTGCARINQSSTPYTGPNAIPTVQVRSAERGATLHTAVGHDVHVVLEGQGWSFDAAPADLVAVAVPSASSGIEACRGAAQTASCGTTSITYRAERVGTVVLSAARTMCGDARRCTGDEGAFSIRMVLGRGVSSR
jgi:hypothetical protein